MWLIAHYPKTWPAGLADCPKRPKSDISLSVFLLLDQAMTMLAHIDSIYDSVKEFSMPSYRVRCFQVAGTHKSQPGHPRTYPSWPIWPQITLKIGAKRLITGLREQLFYLLCHSDFRKVLHVTITLRFKWSAIVYVWLVSEHLVGKAVKIGSRKLKIN